MCIRDSFSAWVEQGFGTGDACIIADGVMEIIDLKFGTGVPVFAENNADVYKRQALLLLLCLKLHQGISPNPD